VLRVLTTGLEAARFGKAWMRVMIVWCGNACRGGDAAECGDGRGERSPIGHVFVITGVNTR
jgi:hypothetical protein